jgi:hypothetical protein
MVCIIQSLEIDYFGYNYLFLKVIKGFGWICLNHFCYNNSTFAF